MKKFPYKVVLWDAANAELHPAYLSWLEHRYSTGTAIGDISDLRDLIKLGITAKKITDFNRNDYGEEHVVIRNQQDELIWSQFCLEWS